MKIFLTGGNGLLGKEIQKNIDVYAPSHNEFNISNFSNLLTIVGDLSEYDLIIHAAAYTQVEQAEIKRQECFETNIIGTMNMLEAFKKVPFVFISSEYAKNPCNFYALTKRMGEQLVETHPHHLIIRTVFKSRPWKYPKAFIDQYTQGDYVDVIAPLILQNIVNWDLQSKTIYIGTGRKTIYELAQQTRTVEPISVHDVAVKLPMDYL